MLNGQLKPGYNIQVGTENNFVIGYDVFPNPTDTRTFILHLENVQKRLGYKFNFQLRMLVMEAKRITIIWKKMKSQES